MNRCPHRWLAIVALALGLTGCGWMLQQHATHGMPALPNPLAINEPDVDFLWNQLVDTIDDYFPIAREERVRWVGDIMAEGRIETQATSGASALEIFRRDATPGFQRWHGTFQSLRRQAEVRVLPAPSGYQVQVVVRKELEDVDRPEMSSVGGAVQRHDGTLVRPQTNQVGGATSLGWIPLGRDVELEQKILADIYARMNHVETPPPVQPIHDHHGRRPAR